jgi:hypothetical protein
MKLHDHPLCGCSSVPRGQTDEQTRQAVDFRNCFANAPKTEGLTSKLLATDHGEMMSEDIRES